MAKITYSVAMAQAVRRVKKPVKGLVVDVIALPDFLAVRVYEENILEYSDNQREAIMSYLLTVRDLIRSYGTPCHLDGARGVPRKRK